MWIVRSFSDTVGLGGSVTIGRVGSPRSMSFTDSAIEEKVSQGIHILSFIT